MKLGLGLGLNKSSGYIKEGIFEFTIDTSLGTGATYTIPLSATGEYDFTVDWGDMTSDTITTYNQAETTHTYSSGGVYTIQIVGLCNGWKTDPQSSNRNKVVNISSWGDIRPSADLYTFGLYENMNISAKDKLDTRGLTNLSYYFQGCISLDSPIEKWLDLKGVNNVQGMLSGCKNFNHSIDGLDWSTITNASSFLADYSQEAVFNQPVNISSNSIVDINNFLYGQVSFNSDVILNTPNVTDYSNVLGGCLAYNKTIENIDLTSAKNIAYLVGFSTGFNQDIDITLTTSDACDCTGLLYDTSFNSDINLQGPNITSMTSLFRNSDFNGTIANIDTSKVNSFSGMFRGSPFNHPSITTMNTNSASNFSDMFRDDTAFDQDVSGFTIANVSLMTRMFQGSGFGNNNYDLLLVAWNGKAKKNSVTFHAGTAKYSSGAPATARAQLVKSVATGGNGWIITDGGAL